MLILSLRNCLILCEQKHNLVLHSPFHIWHRASTSVFVPNFLNYDWANRCEGLPRTWNSNGASTAWVNPSNHPADAFGQIRNWKDDLANVSTWSISLSSVQICGAKSLNTNWQSSQSMQHILWEQATCLVSSVQCIPYGICKLGVKVQSPR